MGLPHRARHLPQQLSGGQQQRVAVARALVAAPKLILADEPTGNLDTANGDAVMAMLTDIAKARHHGRHGHAQPRARRLRRAHDRICSTAFFLGEDLAKASERRRTLLRRAHVGFVFQSFNLIDELTVAENVEVALIYRGVRVPERRRRIAATLERVGLPHRARHLPQQLSGGQQQRVAVARALVAEPKLILADEPTGNLDTANGNAVLGMLTDIAASGTTVVMVTHSEAHAAAAGRTLHLLDGQLEPAIRLAA